MNRRYRLRKALLIVDRGSREPDVKQELQEICSIARRRAGYDYADYCFLEVLPPFIKEGISKCIANDIGFITIMPYFLYPGMKLKDAVKQSAKIGKDMKLNMAITKPLSYHPMMDQLIVDRINQLKKERAIKLHDKECDIVFIGHGSSDRNARDAFIHAANMISPRYHKVHFCFLELDHPNIEEGIAEAIADNPKVILIMPYFLHRGAHIKTDVVKEVDAALGKYKFTNAFTAGHLGVDEKLVGLVIERAREVEKRFGV
jgi:sirohydrochlorin ferrochelatase